MREIKFRAWEKNLKEMIEVKSVSFKKKIINQGGAWRFFEEIELMQYTGLKDINGCEVYEGDIILLRHETGYMERDISKEVVTFENGAFSCNIYSELDGTCDCKVIGNIYENPELLK